MEDPRDHYYHLSRYHKHLENTRHSSLDSSLDFVLWYSDYCRLQTDDD